jgi:two-component system cell cycle sensor histidine kinase/response regulator CckA
VLDETERVLAEQYLRESEQRFRAMVENAQNAIATTGPSGRYVLWNSALRSLTGYSDAEIEAMQAGDLTAPESRQRALAWPERRLAGGDAPRTYETVLAHRSGERIPALMSVTVLRDGEGQIGGTLLEIVDLREQIALREQLARSQKTEALGTLVAGIAHDFNNLLTAMGGSLAIARDDPGEPEAWENAQLSLDRATDLVRQLLRFSRRDEPASRPVSLQDAVDEAVRLARETFDRRIAVNVSVADGDPHAQMDPGQLQQVLINLLLNARDAVMERLDADDASGYRAAIAIDVAVEAPARDGTTECIIVRVADNGGGMSEETRSRVFDPFFTTKEVGKGTGLGLSTTFGIVASHHGEIAVESSPGAGTTFTLKLPAAEADEAASHDAPERASPAVPGEGSILVVDDEPILRDVARAALEGVGLDVEIAEGGAEAIAAVERRRFDLVVLDVNMPRPNGWETIDRLRAIAPELPVLMASGDSSGSEARDRGAIGLLPKPYNRRELIAAVSEALAPD